MWNVGEGRARSLRIVIVGEGRARRLKIVVGEGRARRLQIVILSAVYHDVIDAYVPVKYMHFLDKFLVS